MDMDVAIVPTVAGRIAEQAARLAGSGTFLRLLDATGRAAEHTYAQLLARARRWAGLYAAKGLTGGDGVVVVLPHSLDLYAAYLGAVLAGLTPAMFAGPSPKMSRQAYFRTVSQLLADSGAKAMVAVPELGQLLAAVTAARGVDIAILDPAEADRHAQAETVLRVDPDAMAFVQYSSGTTGLKKAVGISHRALLWQVDAYAEAIGLRVGDVIASWLPLYHDMGLIACFWLPVLRGTPVVAISPFDWVRRPAMLLEAVTRHAATLCWLPNFAYNHIARSVGPEELAGLDLSSLRGVTNCSEPVLAGSHEALLAKLGPHGLRREALWTCYAMAENTFAVTTGGPGGKVMVDSVDARRWATGAAAPVSANAADARRMVSSGRPVAGVDVRIIGLDGEELPDRTVGQIVLRSPSLAAGYVNNAAATAEAFRGDGWCRTGDLGYCVGDELFVTGRQNDLIIIAGKNVWPGDIEALANGVSGVIPGRCVALGLADEEAGTEQLVVLAETHATDADGRREIVGEIRQRIAQATDVTARDIRLLEHMWLSKSSSGKIARGENLRRYRELTEPGVADGQATQRANEGGLTDRVARVVADVLADAGVEVPSAGVEHAKLITGGLIDSLRLVHLTLAIESEFGVKIPPAAQTTLSYFDGVAPLAALVEQLTDQPAGQGQTAPAVAVVDIAPMAPGQSVRDRKCADLLAGRRKHDLFILGSSRTMAMRAEVANGRGYRAYNFSVNGAMAEDWYCCFRFIQAHNQLVPRRLLIGIDIEAFSSQLDIDLRLLAAEHLRDYLDDSDAPAADPAPDGPDDEHRRRFEIIQRRLKAQNIDNTRPFGYRPDTGDLVFLGDDEASTVFNARRPVTIADPAGRNNEYRLRMGHYTALNSKRLHYFVRVIQACLPNNVAVTCFLTPTHPTLHAFMQANTTYAARLSDFRAGLSLPNGPKFQFLDCSTPSLFGGADTDFTDAAHLGGHNADKLLNYLLDAAEGA